MDKMVQLLGIALILTNICAIKLLYRISKLERMQESQRIFNRSQININQQHAEKINILTSEAIIKQEEESETKVGELDDWYSLQQRSRTV